MNEKKPTSKVGLVDSNMLVYIVDALEKEKHEKAEKFLEAISNNPSKFVISLQNLREFCSVIIKKKKVQLEDVLEYISLFKETFPLILYDDVEDVLTASKNSIEKNLSFWDCLLAATMNRYKIEIIYTENENDFKNFEGIQVVNPLI